MFNFFWTKNFLPKNPSKLLCLSHCFQKKKKLPKKILNCCFKCVCHCHFLLQNKNLMKKFLGRKCPGLTMDLSLWHLCSRWTHRRLPSHSDHFTAHLSNGMMPGESTGWRLRKRKKNIQIQMAIHFGFQQCFFLGKKNYTKDRQCWNLKVWPAMAADLTLTQILATQPRWCPITGSLGMSNIKYRQWCLCSFGKCITIGTKKTQSLPQGDLIFSTSCSIDLQPLSQVLWDLPAELSGVSPKSQHLNLRSSEFQNSYAFPEKKKMLGQKKRCCSLKSSPTTSQNSALADLNHLLVQPAKPSWTGDRPPFPGVLRTSSKIRFVDINGYQWLLFRIKVSKIMMSMDVNGTVYSIS